MHAGISFQLRVVPIFLYSNLCRFQISAPLLKDKLHLFKVCICMVDHKYFAHAIVNKSADAFLDRVPIERIKALIDSPFCCDWLTRPFIFKQKVYFNAVLINITPGENVIWVSVCVGVEWGWVNWWMGVWWGAGCVWVWMWVGWVDWSGVG